MWYVLCCLGQSYSFSLHLLYSECTFFAIWVVQVVAGIELTLSKTNLFLLLEILCLIFEKITFYFFSPVILTVYSLYKISDWIHILSLLSFFKLKTSSNSIFFINPQMHDPSLCITGFHFISLIEILSVTWFIIYNTQPSVFMMASNSMLWIKLVLAFFLFL